jgi:stearoyl-CoA desaturase (Delta-9 desaturase)
MKRNTGSAVFFGIFFSWAIFCISIPMIFSVPAVHWWTFSVTVPLCAISITGYFHRCVTHKSFEARLPIRLLGSTFGRWSIQGGPAEWAAIHKKHHTYSEGSQDPHSPFRYVVLGTSLWRQKWAVTKGLIWAQFGWLIYSPASVVEAIQDVKKNQTTTDNLLTWFWGIMGFGIPIFIACSVESWTLGTAFIAASFAALRLFTVWHITWSINSITHIFGTQPFKDTGDRSKNSLLTGILAWGEGWHNNHHAYPGSAFHGFTWWQIDVTGWLIRGLERVNLVHHIVRIPKNSITRRLKKARATT